MNGREGERAPTFPQHAVLKVIVQRVGQPLPPPLPETTR